jgi:aryl-alcohol dehydrogenase-like predicted oxidoreductase
MKYRILGQTGLRVSVIGIGTWQFGGEWGKDFTPREAAEILNAAKEAGINLIDTAECYGDHLSEALIGQYLANDRREDWVIATKFGHYFHKKFERTKDYTAEGVLKQLDASLKALQTDYIDLYQFHSGDDEAFDNDDLWTMLDKQVQAGKIRHIGLSIAKNDNIYQVRNAGKTGAKAIQIIYNRLDREPEAEVFPSCQAQNLGVLARVPLASGYLTGKYKPGAAFGSDDVRHRHDPQWLQQRLETAQEIIRNEIPEKMDPAQWALAWCLKHPAVTCVIPGCKSVEQVRRNAEAARYVGDDHPQSAAAGP